MIAGELYRKPEAIESPATRGKPSGKYYSQVKPLGTEDQGHNKDEVPVPEDRRQDWGY